MEVNSKILEIFQEYNISKDDGLTYLICLFHNLNPSYIPERLKQKVNVTGIIEERNKSIHWNIPLYNNQETEFSWVENEYIQMFINANPEKKGNKREAVKRMKKLFAEYPEIRKEEVLGATKLYIENTDFKYIRFPHYFIEKGRGNNKIRDILEWIDRYKNLETENRTSIRNTLQ